MVSCFHAKESWVLGIKGRQCLSDYVPAWMADGSGSRGSLQLQDKAGEDTASIFTITYMVIRIVSFLEDCMMHSLLFVCCFSYLFIRNICTCNQPNHKAHKGSKSNLVSVYSEIQIVVLSLGVCIQWLNKSQFREIQRPVSCRGLE